MADADAISRSAAIAMQNDASVIVVSATKGTTNLLIDLAHAVFSNQQAEAEKIVSKVIASHQKIAKNLRAGTEQLANLDEIFEELQTIARHTGLASMHHAKLTDRILGCGEQIASNLMVAAMLQKNTKADLVDARQIIRTDDHFGQATPLIDLIKESVQQVLMPKLDGNIIVTQGFIGQSPEGDMTTLGRGGSDYTGALIAEALQAHQLQIWTDTPGISSADPRVIKSAQRIDHLSFQEAAELATAGARVLYPKTITPTRRAKIPVFVGNTFDPAAGGTTISIESSHKPLVRAIAIKPSQSIVKLTTPEMAHQFGFLAKIFDLFARFKISIDQISTSEIAVAVVLENQNLINKELFKELEKLGEVTVEKGLSVISIIGNNVNKAPGLAQDIFANLEDAGEKISVRMICQGASYHNFCFVISDKHGLNMVNKLHKKFIEKEG